MFLFFRTIFKIPIFICLIANSICSSIEPKVGILFIKGLVGEAAFGNRINQACKNLGWESEIINEDRFENFTGKGFDFVICLTEGKFKQITCSKFLLVFLPDNIQRIFFDANWNFLPEYSDFDAYLTSFDPMNYSTTKKTFDKFNPPFLIWYPTVHELKIQANQRKSLFVMNNLWGDRAKSDKFLKLFHLLSRQKDVSIYGKDNGKIKTKGILPFDDESLYKISSECGISLIIHSSLHRQYGIPTGRIFEAAAVGNVIICDKNRFVEEEFGYNVLYIDVNLDYAQLYKQIRGHMNWIQENPQEADIMAKNVRRIFQEKFLLENQLLELKKLYEK